MANPGTPLLTVMDISRVVARVNVPQSQAGTVKVGQPATVTQADSGEEVAGKVIVVSPATDPDSTTVQVWVEVENPGERLKPGASVHAAIVTEMFKAATVVPVAAILPGEEGGTAVLTVSADSIAHKRTVELGVREGDKVADPERRPARRRGGGRGRHGRGRQGQGEDRHYRRRRDDDEDEHAPDAAGARQEMSDLSTPPPVRRRPRTRRTGPPATASRSSSSSSPWSPWASTWRSPSPWPCFPETDFPRIVVGVDNGVFPIDQMLVTVTRPLEEAVNTVPGLDYVWSITSRGTAEIDLFFDWNVDMYRTLELVNAALARVQPTLPPTAKIAANRLTFAAFPIMGYSLTSDTVPQTRTLGDGHLRPSSRG